MTLVSRLLLSALLLLPFAAPAAPAAALQEGRDFQRIAQPGPFAPLAGKIEVVEVFGYTCPHCAQFEKVLGPWAAKLPADVRFTPVPGAFGGPWDDWARAYYAADQLGVAKRSHAAVFKALHETGSLPFQNVGADELGTFYKAYGVAPAAFQAALRSEAVQQKVTAARTFAGRVKITGTPTLVINGTYTVIGRNFEDQLRISDALIQQIRAGKAP